MIGRFEGFKCIGRGGFGVVYRARDHQLGRDVAVKLCPNPEPDVIEAFQREAKILAMFSHPNIVTVHEVGWHGEDFFYAMELIEGCDGAHYIASKPTWRAALEIYEAAAAGLAAAHAKGIVHGDFKPANVLIGDDGRVCVADFGLAQSIGKADRTSDASPWAGTMPYMAPELHVGGRPNASTDQWALCASLWETLYRCRPFEGITPTALFSAIVSGKPRVPLRAPSVPGVLRDLLCRGMAAEPSDRFSSMQALIEALVEIRSPMPTLQSSGATLDASRTRPWLPFVQGVVVTLVLGSALVLGGLGWLDRRGVELREPAPPHTVKPPCALGDEVSVELDPMVVAVCTLIRDGEFLEANRVWSDEHRHRVTENKPALGEHTLIIARTFVEQAEAIEDNDGVQARVAAARALVWAREAAALLGEDDAEVKAVREAAEIISRTD